MSSPARFEYDPEESELHNLCEALGSIAQALRELGSNDAATPMGAVEMVAKELHDGFQLLEAAVLAFVDRES